MDTLSEQHIQWLNAQNDRAANTVTSRRRVLKSIGNAGTATRDEMDAWWTTRAQLAIGTRIVDLSHAREFYKWCSIFEHRMDDPTVRIRAPRGDTIPYDTQKISNDQIADLAKVLPPDLRRAVFLGAGAGLRVSESAALDWADVDSATDMLRVRLSKGKKTRYVPIAPELIRMLGDGVEERMGNVLRPGEPAHTPAQLQRRLNRAMRSAGAEFTSHDLRHRFGITAYRSLPDLLAVGEMMGHSSTNTTKLYASPDSAAKRKIASAVMW